jgi:hypothetical protein
VRKIEVAGPVLVLANCSVRLEALAASNQSKMAGQIM